MNSETNTPHPLMNGAEVIAAVLAECGVRSVFAYPGTSELSLCDALCATSIRLINARGDKEAVFMAAGGSLLSPGASASLVHGARGLTNAAGAVADANRNEIATLVLVGLPSTASIRFLPPHGEAHLLEGIGKFVKHWYAPIEVPGPHQAEQVAQAWVGQIRAAVALSRQPPYGPVMLGIPQDVAEKRWFPRNCWGLASLGGSDQAREDGPLALAAQRIHALHSLVILVDDYYLKYPGAEAALDEFATSIGAPVLQVRYRRGPMLFQRLSRSRVRHFVGWYDPHDARHRQLLHSADGLVLLEDRNMYQRVIGALPQVFKLSVTSSPAKTLKNEIMGPDDLVLAGAPVQSLLDLSKQLKISPPRHHSPQRAAPFEPLEAPTELPADVHRFRQALVAVFGDILREAAHPVLVDDSQMFGGLLAQGYDHFPPTLRVFGSHGGFVGSGLAYATGLALSEPQSTVFCTLGDQGYTNAIQGLVAAVQEQAKVCFIVCNNGGSVSLRDQSRSAEMAKLPQSNFLSNSPLQYAAVAQAMGLPSFEIPFGGDAASTAKAERPMQELRQRLKDFLMGDGSMLIELRLPSAADFWRGIWMDKGFDEQAVPATA